MSDEVIPAIIDGATLAAAFPNKHQFAAMAAATEVARSLDPRYWWGQFVAEVEGGAVLIPIRLHFVSHGLALPKSDEAWRFARALMTRSTDGFERQRAAGDLLRQPESWAAPFVTLLIGEYVIEILDDISAALTLELEQVLGVFIADNMAFWETTKRRVTSYWNAYYRRWGSEGGQRFSSNEYVGFKIVDRLEAAASRYA